MADLAAADTSQLLYPLSLFCDKNDRAVQTIRRIADADLSEPYRSLLVHDSDMTSKLEEFHQGSIELQVLHCSTEGNSHLREVVLRLRGSKQPVEYGAIDINLAAFQNPVLELILQGQRPLGGILSEFEIQYESRPRAFIELTSDTFINSAIRLTQPTVLYGRRNVLMKNSGEPLAHIIEILPPSR